MHKDYNHPPDGCKELFAAFAVIAVIAAFDAIDAIDEAHPSSQTDGLVMHRYY